MSIDHIGVFFDSEKNAWRGKMELFSPFGDDVYFTMEKEKIVFDEDNPCNTTKEMQLYAEAMQEKIAAFSVLKDSKKLNEFVLVEEGMHQKGTLYWSNFRYGEFNISLVYAKDESYQQFSVYVDEIKVKSEENLQSFERVSLKYADLFLGKEKIEQIKRTLKQKSNQRLRLLHW